MTIEPHERFSDSYLSNDNQQEISYRGMVNLLCLILLSYHIRMVAASFEEHNFRLAKELSDFWNSGVLSDPRSYTTALAALLAVGFPICGYCIEIVAKFVPNNKIITTLIIGNLIGLWAYPVIMI